MNILMMSNTYTPLVGGLERSVKNFTLAYRRRGHRVIIVAPIFERMPRKERSVLRIPTLQHVNGSPFAVKLPLPPRLTSRLVRFQPDIVHAHHPFLIGSTALRLAHTHKIPLVYTYHTLFEQYTQWLPRRSRAMQRFVIELATGYANLCDRVFAPSESVARMLTARDTEQSRWETTIRRIGAEWQLLKNVTKATVAAVKNRPTAPRRAEKKAREGDQERRSSVSAASSHRGDAMAVGIQNSSSRYSLGPTVEQCRRGKRAQRSVWCRRERRMRS